MAKSKAAKDYTEYPGKAETPFQERFADWALSDVVGVDPSQFKTKLEAFRMGIKLGTSLRIEYQKSDDNQSVRSSAAEAREAAKLTRKANKGKAKAAAEEPDDEDADDDEDEDEAPAPKPKAKGKAKGKAKAAPVVEDDDDDDEEPAPAPKAKKAGRAKAKAKPKPAEDDDEGDDF